jgi:hypothetical protein
VKAGGYFTLAMLNDIRTARKGMVGLDPNEDEKSQLQRWLDLHEKKRSDRGRGRKKTPSLERGRHKPDGSSTRRRADPKTGVSALLQNVARQGGSSKKNYAETGGPSTQTGPGTGKPPSRRSAPQKS